MFHAIGLARGQKKAHAERKETVIENFKIAGNHTILLGYVEMYNPGYLPEMFLAIWAGVVYSALFCLGLWLYHKSRKWFIVFLIWLMLYLVLSIPWSYELYKFSMRTPGPELSLEGAILFYFGLTPLIGTFLPFITMPLQTALSYGIAYTLLYLYLRHKERKKEK